VKPAAIWKSSGSCGGSRRRQDHCRFPQGQRPAIKKVRSQFVELCREMGLLTKASVAIDGSKFKAVNNRDKNFTRGKVERRRHSWRSVARYLSQLDTADQQEPSRRSPSRRKG